MRWFGDVIRGNTLLRHGFLGIGGNGPDKQKEAASQANLNNVFSYGLGTGQTGQSAGQSDLGQAAGYWQSLLSAGRTQTAQNAAPAVNAAVAGADATRAQRAQFGSGRSGGTVAADANSSTATQKNIDDIINENLVGGKAAGAKGLQSAGGTELQNSLGLLGLGTGAEGDVLSSAEADRAGVRSAQTQIWGDVINGLL